jgi:hypothetical protein
MARKTLNRKELRDQVDAAERVAERVEADAPAKKKAPAKRKSRAKVPVDVRVKLYWGVFNQSLKGSLSTSLIRRSKPSKKRKH